MSDARLYVGTYGKYAAGSIAGKWMNLDDYADKEDFLKACAELHKDEHDPEFMFQDFEGFPRAMYSESYVGDELWDWIKLSDDDRELLEVYTDNIDGEGTIEQARDAFYGRFNSEAEWAEDWLDNTGGLEGCPEHLRNYIDYEAYARDSDVTFIRHSGDLWAFRNS